MGAAVEPDPVVRGKYDGQRSWSSTVLDHYAHFVGATPAAVVFQEEP
jgi:hypothetical protein